MNKTILLKDLLKILDYKKEVSIRKIETKEELVYGFSVEYLFSVARDFLNNEVAKVSVTTAWDEQILVIYIQVN